MRGRNVVLVAASALAITTLTTIAIVGLHATEPADHSCRYEEPRPAPPPIEFREPAFAKRPSPPPPRPIDRGPAPAPVA